MKEILNFYLPILVSILTALFIRRLGVFANLFISGHSLHQKKDREILQTILGVLFYFFWVLVFGGIWIWIKGETEIGIVVWILASIVLVVGILFYLRLRRKIGIEEGWVK